MCQRWRHEKEKHATEHSEAAKTSPKDDFFINHLHRTHTAIRHCSNIFRSKIRKSMIWLVAMFKSSKVSWQNITRRWDDRSSSLKLSVVLMLWLMGADLQHIGGALWPMLCTMLGSRCLLVTWWCMTFMNVVGLCGCWKPRFKAETKNPIVHSCFRLHMKTNYIRSIKHFHIC